MIRFVLLGSGYRARYYVRLAQSHRDEFSLASMYTHDIHRASALRSEGLPAVASLNVALGVPHDLVVVASGPKGLVATLRELSSRGEKIVVETSFLTLTEEEKARLSGIDALVMEQYPQSDVFRWAREKLPLIGEADQLTLSGLHNHHAVAVARFLLGTGEAPLEVLASQSFSSSCVKTGSRDGVCTSGEAEEYVRRIDLCKLGDKLFVYDQSGNQYHSSLFGLSFQLRGRKGTLTESGVTYLSGETNLPVTDRFLGETRVTVASDEKAIRSMLEAYAAGTNLYPLSEGLLDARYGALL